MTAPPPATRLATLALLAGIVAAFVGAIVVNAVQPEDTPLPPEHPLFGR